MEPRDVVQDTYSFHHKAVHKHFHFLYFEQTAWCCLYIDDVLQEQGYYQLKEVEEYLRERADFLNISVTSSIESYEYYSKASRPLKYYYRGK